MVLNLQTIAAKLEGLEETIIAALIERAQFKRNNVAYQKGQSGFSDNTLESLFEIRLRFVEEMDAQFGRFCIPEERPFISTLPKPSRIVNVGTTGLFITNFNLVNVTEKIASAYIVLLDTLCGPGDDGHFGSSVEHDVHALQALSRRIHFGALYVAESKYHDNERQYRALINSRDIDTLLSLLTRTSVEEAILGRVHEKVEYAQAKANPLIRHIVDPMHIVNFYRDYIIPLTKEGEIAYLLNRDNS